MRLITVLVSGLCALGAAQAREKATKPAEAKAAPPRPDFTKLAFLVAEGAPWKCEATVTPPPNLGKQHHATAKVTVSSVVGGAWRRLHVVEAKTAENPMPFDIEESYSGMGNQFIRYALDNFGGSMWGAGAVENDKVSFVGDAFMGPQKIPSRITFEKRASDLKVDLEFQGPDGKWMDAWDGVCKR